MNLSRRQFWKLAASGVVGAVVTANVDIEKLLWVPGEKTYFLPAEKAFGGNTLITTEWLTKEVLRVMKQNLKLANRYYDNAYVGATVGSTVMVREPQVFKVHNSIYTPQRIVDSVKPVTLKHQYCVDYMTTARDQVEPVEVARFQAQSIGERLADGMNKEKCDVFGRLHEPKGVESVYTATDPETGASVRGIRVYDILTDAYFQRFDVLGGSTHEG